MNLRKSIFSYIVLAAFAVLCCFGVVFALKTAGITEMLHWPVAGVVGAVCGYLLFSAAVFMALRVICAEIRRNIRNPKRLETILSVVLPVLILTGVVAYIVFYLAYRAPLMLEDDRFYRQAIVSGGHHIVFDAHGASWLYTWLLHVMLLIFGNTPFAGIVLQIVLFFTCLLLLYIGMQAFAGTVPAAVSMAAFGFLPVSLSYVFSLTPEFFYLALYLAGFCLTGAIYGKFAQHGKFALPHYFLIFLTGLYGGFLLCLDIYGISLYLFLAILYSVDKEKIKQAAGANLLAAFGGICGFFASVMVVGLTEKISFFQYLKNYLELYFPVNGIFPSTDRLIDLMPDITLTGSMVLMTLSFFMVPAFFVWKRSQGSAFIINLLFLCGSAVFSVCRLNVQMMAACAWSILAGVGSYGVIRQSEISGKKEKAAEKERIKEMTEKEEKTFEQPAAEKREQEDPAPGEPLHNPLPVPKKKKRSSMDFGHPVKETDMEFDIDISDEDDFDW